MTRPHPIERHAINDAATLHEIARRIPQVLANLADNIPDSPGASTGGTGSHNTTSPVEAAHARHLLDDQALADWAELQRLDRALHPLLRRYLDLTSRWMFTRQLGSQRHARPTTDEDWCASCLRIDWFTPRADGRGDRCDWCYRFRLAEGIDPPLALLHARRDGKRITDEMVRHAKTHVRKRRRR